MDRGRSRSPHPRSRVDEALDVCKRLWTEPSVEHHREFFDFDAVVFEPKPVQKPWPPLHCGGESPAALRRAALQCDGWYGLVHDVESAAARVKELRRMLREAGREGARFEVSLGGKLRDPDDARRWQDAGVDRLVVSPWQRSPECIDGLRRFAERMLR